MLVEQVPDLGEGSPDGGAAGAGQVGEGVVGQAEAQVEDGGHDAVGEGEDGWPARAGPVPGVAGGMAAHPPLAPGLPQGGELGDQLVQVGGGQPGQLGEVCGAAVLAGAGSWLCGVPGGGVECVVPLCAGPDYVNPGGLWGVIAGRGGPAGGPDHIIGSG